VSVGSWSLEGIELAPQQLTAASLPQIGGKGEPVGLLGSDVLGRFGAVRIDFAAGTLVVAGAEDPPLSGGTPYTGPVGQLGPPVSLTHGQGTTVPLTVTPSPGAVSLGVAVRFPGREPARDESGAAPSDGLLGHHRPPRAQWSLVGAEGRVAPPADRGDGLRRHQRRRDRGAPRLRSAQALRLGGLGLPQRGDGPRLRRPHRCSADLVTPGRTPIG